MLGVGLTVIAFGAAHRAMQDDDDDPYGTAEASSSSLAFAFDNNAEADDDIVVMGEPAPKTDKPKPPGSTDTWHDGRPVLQGFVLDPLGVPTDKWYVQARPAGRYEIERDMLRWQV